MRNLCGFRSETIAAEYESDAALAERGASDSPMRILGQFPPEDHYFWSAWRAEVALREKDFEWISSKASSSASATSTGSV